MDVDAAEWRQSATPRGHDMGAAEKRRAKRRAAKAREVEEVRLDRLERRARVRGARRRMRREQRARSIAPPSPCRSSARRRARRYAR